MATLFEMRQRETAVQIAVMQAYLAGKRIVCWSKDGGSHAGRHETRYPVWNWSNFYYEVEDAQETSDLG